VSTLPRIRLSSGPNAGRLLKDILKRFELNGLTTLTQRCGGRLRVIASIEAPAVIERILEHLGRDTESVDPAHPSRAPPQGDLSI
jgi:hypothetical protein